MQNGIKEKEVNFMAGNIYNIGFIYFLLKHVYKLREDEEMIFLYTHHRKHIKTTISLLRALKQGGICITELAQSSFLHLMVRLCLDIVTA